MDEVWHIHRMNIIWLLKIVKLIFINWNAKTGRELVINEHVHVVL